MFAIFPEILQVAQKGDLETLACLVRKYFAERQVYAPRLRVEPLLSMMGISFTREPSPFAARIQVLDLKGQYRVAITIDARLLDTGEINYTLAHLLGHFLLAMQPLMARGELSAEAYQLQAGALSRLLSPPHANRSSNSSPQSLAADGFAQALLLPLGMVKKAHQKLPLASDLAGFFHVHSELMQARMLSLGLEPTKPKAEKVEVAASAPPREPTPPSRTQAPMRSNKSGSLDRVQKSVAKLSYQKEEKRENINGSGSAKGERGSAKVRGQSEAEAEAGEGLQRLRQLAKKIDRSVDV